MTVPDPAAFTGLHVARCQSRTAAIEGANDNDVMTRIAGPIDGVDYHQFYVYADVSDSFPAYPASPSYPGRLLATVDNSHAVCVETGIAMGTVVLEVELLDGPPMRLDSTRNWEVIAEVSFEATRSWGSVFFLQTYPAEVPSMFESFDLPAGSGWYRVRGHAVGRALDFDAVVAAGTPYHCEPREFHLLQIWATVGPNDATRIRDDDPWANQYPPATC